ncbi:hypothetical protein [Streptomyces nanshensis]|uniref:Uncharacterized protein n=1 Tax=Streptomyces nanshensis TaxID=518642 RepID=A0A1E7KZ55_9ACTN|nr:hypothetical protein [Streptomyces nanshensis]OEV09216.1 hypothetical protein AN218_22330 [Streptomyces nanshensis]OEV13621.1 hypothetical protein AN218_02645 [Streptomyces nanshensis]
METPYNIGISATGPLPRGWHRVWWKAENGKTKTVLACDFDVAVQTQAALQHTLDEPVAMESWSDEENVSRA